MVDRTPIAEGSFVGTRGEELFTLSAMPPEPRALIVLLHGFGDHAGRYGAFFDYFSSRGYAVASFDQQGHGRSDGKRGDISTFRTWVDDAHLFVANMREKVGQDVPLIVLGHSVGGAAGIAYASEASDVHAAVISAPALRLGIPLWQKIVGYSLSYLVPFLFVPSGIAPEKLSRRPEVIAEYRDSPLVLHRLTLRLLREMIRFGLDVRKIAEKIACPILMIHERDDEICSASGTRAFFERVVFSTKKLILYDGAYHEPLNDTIAETVCDDVLRWIEEVLSGGDGEKA